MARGKQLQELVDDLKAEARWASSVSAGTGALPYLKTLLRRTQEQLYDDYDWPHLTVIKSKQLAKGQRYYDFPSDLSLEGIRQVVCWWSGEPHDVERGIDYSNYAAYDSESDERSDPVLRWDVRYTGSTEQIEVWPIPATDYSSSNGYRLEFIGKRDLQPLTSDSDTADLDDRLLVLFAASEVLASQDSGDAQAKLAQAKQRLARLKGRSQGGGQPFVMGGGQMPKKPRGTIIRVSS